MPILGYNNYYATMTFIPFIPFFAIIVGYRIKRMRRASALEMRKWVFRAEIAISIVTGLVYFFGSSIWFVAVFNKWDYSQACAQGWNKLDWINFVLILIMSCVFTLVTIVLLAWLTIAIPVILLTIVFHYALWGQNN
jgi:hypothetical protein